MGKVTEGLTLLKVIEKEQTSTLGKTHPDTIETKTDMAVFLENLGKLDDALKVNEQLQYIQDLSSEL